MSGVNANSDSITGISLEISDNNASSLHSDMQNEISPQRHIEELFVNINTRRANIDALKNYYLANLNLYDELKRLIYEDRDNASDHRAGVFCVLYEIITSTTDSGLKDIWVDLMKEVAPKYLRSHRNPKYQELLLKIISYMSRMTSLADQLDIWREVVKNAQMTPTTPTAEPKKIGNGNISPSPVTSPAIDSGPQLTLSQFLLEQCSDGCLFLANRILKKLLPALRQPPSTFPLCFTETADILSSDCLSSNGLAHPFSSFPPKAFPHDIQLHPSIPDFMLGSIAHYVLQTYAIPTYLEDKNVDQSILVSKELCESLIRSLTVSSIYLAGKIETATRHLDIKTLVQVAEKLPVQTPFTTVDSLDCDSNKTRSSSMGEPSENGALSEETLERLIKESLSHEKRMLFNLGYEFHEISSPIQHVISWTRMRQLTLQVSSATLDLLWSPAFLERFLLLPVSRRSHYSCLHVGLSFVLMTMSQTLFESESRVYPSNIQDHLSSFLFPFPLCNREDVSIVNDILVDLLKDLPQKKDILDRSLLICPFIYHLCRRVIPKGFLWEYSGYLESKFQTPRFPTFIFPQQFIPMPMCSSPINNFGQSPMPSFQSPPFLFPPPPLIPISCPPPPELCAPINFPPPPKHLLPKYDDEDFERLKTDVRSWLCRWKDQSQLSSSLFVETGDLLSSHKFFAKTSPILCSSNSQYTDATIALVFVITAMAQRLFESEVQAHPTNISEHLTSVLFPFPQCNRNDMSIIHDMLKDILESGAIKKHIFDRCDLIASSSIHFCRGVLPKAFASDYDSYLTSDRAFPSTNEDSDTSYSKRKNKRKKEKKSKKDKKKKKRRKSDKKEEGEVTPEEDLDPDSEQDYEEEEEDDCSDDHWRGAKSSSTRTTSHSQTPLQSPPSKRHVYVIPHRSNRSRERSPRKSKSSNPNRI